MGLLDSHRWMSRWACGDWPVWLAWGIIIAELTIGACYWTIGLSLWRLQRSQIHFAVGTRMALGFALFIFLCGTGHVVDAMVFARPIYYLLGLIYGMTAAVSLWVCIGLCRATPALIAMRTREETEREIERARNDERKQFVVEFSSAVLRLLAQKRVAEIRRDELMAVLAEMEGASHAGHGSDPTSDTG